MNKIKAFTLVELVIVIAVAIILSAISVPIYSGHIKRARMAEGYSLLGAIRDAQARYYNEYGTFYNNGGHYDSSMTSYEEVLGIDARGNQHFTIFTSCRDRNWTRNENFWITVWSKAAGTINLVYHKSSGYTLY